MPDKTWNPIQEVRTKYPGLKDWSDDRILQNLSDPKRFRAAFPQYSNLGDDVIKRNISGLRSANLPPGVRIAGKNAAGRPMYAPEEAAKPVGGAASRFMSSAGQAVGGAVSGLYHGVVEGAQNPEEAKVVEKTGRAGLIAKRFWIDPTAQQMQQTASEFQQARTAPNKYVAREHAQKTAAHALATAVPSVGPWWQQVGEQAGTQWGSGDKAGALGTIAGNAAMLLVPHATKKVFGAGGAAARGATEAITGTGPRGLRKLAQSTVKANVDAAREHLEKTQDALHETAGKELTRAEKVKTTDEVERAKHELDVAKVREANTRARTKHAADVEKVRAENDRIREKHKAVADQIAQENAATDHTLELRRREEAGLQKDTQDYYSKEDTVRKKAKTQENSAWDKWRKKTAVPEDNVDMAPVLGVIGEQLTNTPEAANILRNVESQEGALDPDAQFYKNHRAEVMKYFGYEGDYENLPDDAKANVDQMMSAGGRFPAGKPIDLSEVKSMPLEQIHSVKSNLGYKRFNRSYPPDVRYAMGKIYDSLDKLETAETIKRGGGDELKAAKQETRDYQEAFGQERHAPKTQNDIREKEVNPEEYKARKDQERLNAAKKYDPSLVDDYEKVKARREQLKKLPTEDQLRKARKQIPPPPSPDDLREGYRLKPEPEPPTEDDLRPGYRLQTEPEPPAPAEGTVAPAERVAPPDRPKDQTVTPADRLANIKAGIASTAESLRQQGVRRTINALYYTAPTAVLSTLLGHPGYAFTEVAMAPVILAGSHVLAGLLERPEVVNWISKVTPREVAAFNRLPEEAKAVFTQNLNTMVKAAKKNKLPISQALTAFVAGSGATASTPKTLQQLRQEALDRQQQQLPQQGAPTTSESNSDATTPGTEEPVENQPEQTKPETGDTTTEDEDSNAE